MALLAGGFALAGGLGGVLLSNSLSQRADGRRLKADDDRRWLTDRRTVYGSFLGLVESMLREIDGVAVFLSYDGSQPVSEEDEEILHDGLFDYFNRWEEQLQPALGELELLASPAVADLADRVTAALMEITGIVEKRGAFIGFSPTWFQTEDLIGVLKDAMRVELGVAPLSPEARAARRGEDWPWLADRPSWASYTQKPRVANPGTHTG